MLAEVVNAIAIIVAAGITAWAIRRAAKDDNKSGNDADGNNR